MLKFKTTDSVKNWVTSDSHLGHQRDFIFKPRNYATHYEHTNGVIDKINECCQPNDNLFFLGDFCLNTDESQLNSYFHRIRCQNIYTIWGNHNNPLHRVYRQAIANEFGRDDIEVYPFRYKNMIFMGDYMEVMIDGRMVIMMHYPIDVWNYMKDGAYMLCGHSHCSHPRTKRDATDGLILDCGWEENGKPYEFSEIIKIMNKKKIRAVDHHAN